MAALQIGDNDPPRLPKVVISPEIDPEYYAAMSLHVVQRTEEAAKLSPPAAASCAIASVLFAVWLPDHSRPAEQATPSLLNSPRLRFVGEDVRSGVDEGQNRPAHEAGEGECGVATSGRA